MDRTLRDRVVFITGASRGIGRAIALRCARDGAAVVITAKTSDPHPKLPGTIHSVAEEVEAAGGRALAIQLDVRDEQQIEGAIAKTIETFGRLDVLVNNASAISLTPTVATEMRKFDLMFGVNVRATFATSRLAIPHLRRSDNAHILTLSPPLNLNPQWFGQHLAYTMSKYGMSMCTLGLSNELAPMRIAANSLWPRTLIATAAVEMLLADEGIRGSRKPEIMADAAWFMLTRDAHDYTGNFAIDDEVLAQEGITDLDSYAASPGAELITDLFV